MTNLINKIFDKSKEVIRSTGKSIIPYIVAGSVLIGGTTKAFSQEPISWGANDPMPREVAFNPQEPYRIHESYGRAPLDRDCSGDVNQDGKRDELDALDIENGVVNQYSDVNADGKTDGTDAKFIRDLDSGKISHLPSDWNRLSREEQIEFYFNHHYNVFMKRHNTVTSPIDGREVMLYDNWDCDEYFTQSKLEKTGINNIEKYFKIWGDNSLRRPKDAIFGAANIPIADVSLVYKNGDAPHSAECIIVGNPSNPDNYIILDTQTGDPAGIGSRFIPDETYVEVRKVDYLFSDFLGKSSFLTNTFIQFDVENGKATNIKYHENLILQNPYDFPTFKGGNDTTFNYQENFNILNKNIEEPEIFANKDDNPSLIYSDSDNQSNSGFNKFNYDITRIYTGKTNTGFESKLEQIIKIRDLEAPTFDLPQDASLKIGEESDLEKAGKPSQASDNSNDSIKINYVDSITSEDNVIREVKRTWHAEDISGNIESKIQYLSLEKPSAIYNPNSDEHNLKLRSSGGNLMIDYFADNKKALTVAIFDMNGRILKRIEEQAVPGNNRIVVSKSGFSNGVYIVRVIHANGSIIQSGKFIK